MNARSLLRPSHLAALALALPASFIGCGGGTYQTPVYDDPFAQSGGDRDGDGISDMSDQCVNDPEDGILPKANDGCPATDPDNDGILLADDRCPDAKEDGAPPNPTDGCPTDDTDQDGVANAKDACPAQAEDNLPPNPNDGCPSPDTDGDGIADVHDKCPSEKETMNGNRDDDGCPDQAAGEVAYDDKSHEIVIPETRKIDFQLDSAEIQPEARPTIAEIAKILKQYPQIQRLEIEGHASTKGDKYYNVNLTEKRARAVAQALVDAGVEENRLVPIGYGEYCPAIDRGDEVDDPVNRRVLLKAVQVSGVWQDVPRGCWRAKAAGIDPTKRKPGLSQSQAPSPGPTNPTPPPVTPAGGA
ncbi:MAG: OmpA family protein [Polyangiaceae bacterium]|nr:OmpA family protein [Polyangiaceae bacterium]